MMRFTAAAFLLTATALFGSEFQSGQAARAVLGQSSFTSRDSGIKATALQISNRRLYAADATGHVFTFDLSRIPDVREDRAGAAGAGCLLCGFEPVGVTGQAVVPGIAAFAVWGKSAAFADSTNHRILIWRDTSTTRLDRSPDVVLGRGLATANAAGMPMNPVAVALDGKRLFVGDSTLHRVLVWNSIPASDDQPADAVLGQPDFETTAANELPSPNTFAVPAALASDGSNLFIADTGNRRILIFSPGDAPLPADSIENSASLSNGPVAPGALISINGKDLSDQTQEAASDSAKPLPKSLGGTEVVLDGEALPLLAVSREQVQAQIPYDLGTRTAASIYLRIEHKDGAVTITNAGAVQFAAAAPGLYGFEGAEPRDGIVLRSAVNQDSAGGSPITEENPARPGEAITVLATGLGAVSEPGNPTVMAGVPYDGSSGQVTTPLTAEINGQAASVIDAKLPLGSVGVYQIRLVVPGGIGPASLATVTVTQNGQRSNAVTFPVAAKD